MNYTDHILQLSLPLAYLATFLIVFAESGLLIGFFLPGDSLLFTLGLLAAQDHFSITTLIIITALGAIAGDSFGYYLGQRFGPRIFNRENSTLFNHKYVDEAHLFYQRYGRMAVILARFTPIIRTFVPTFAGVAEMNYPLFLGYNVIGGISWSLILLGGSYYLGRVFGNLDRYLLLIIVVIVILSLIAPVRTFLKNRRQAKMMQ